MAKTKTKQEVVLKTHRTKEGNVEKEMHSKDGKVFLAAASPL